MQKIAKKDMIARLIAIALMTIGAIIFITVARYSHDKIKEWSERRQEEANRRLGPIEDLQHQMIQACLDRGGVPAIKPLYQTGSGWIRNKLERCDFPK